MKYKNLFTDPLPAGASGWTLDNTNNQGAKAELSFSNGQMLIQGHATDGNAYVHRPVLDLPPNDYVFAFTARSASSPIFYGDRLSTVLNTSWQGFGKIPSASLNSRCVFRFTNPTEQRIIFTFQAPKNDARVAYERILLCTAEDYEQLEQLGLNYFDGNTFKLT